jgi:hypothetical protein
VFGPPASRRTASSGRPNGMASHRPYVPLRRRLQPRAPSPRPDTTARRHPTRTSTSTTAPRNPASSPGTQSSTVTCLPSPQPRLGARPRPGWRARTVTCPGSSAVPAPGRAGCVEPSRARARRYLLRLGYGTRARGAPERAPRPGPNRARARRPHPRLATPPGGHDRASAQAQTDDREWALGSSRAERLSAIVIKEAASDVPAPAGRPGACPGHVIPSGSDR